MVAKLSISYKLEVLFALQSNQSYAYIRRYTIASITGP
jgi:hypothetical protein